MTHDIIVLILSVILGIALYWRESKRNALYRFFNKLTHSKKLQMPAESKKGFLVQQSFLMRAFYLILLFMAVYGLASLIMPFISQFTIIWFVSSVVGSLIGTYIASALLFAEGKIEHSDDLMDDVVDKGKEKFEDLKEKGKDFVEDLKEKHQSKDEAKKEGETETDSESPEEKSARDRFKDQGYIK